MKILCVADVHGFLDGLIQVRNFLVKNSVHTVFLMGDYSTGFKDLGRNRIDAEYAVDELKNNARVYAMPGNCDDPALVDLFEKRGVNLHEKVVELDGVSFLGLGGSNTTPFKTPFELSEEDIGEKLNSLLSQAKTEKTVLVTHFPPKDTNCDIIPGVGHVGSAMLRKVIEDRQPQLCVCSHIHESAGKTDQIKETRIINVGALSHGNVVLLDTTDLGADHLTLQPL